MLNYGGDDFIFCYYEEIQYNVTMSLVIFLIKDGKVEATADGMAINDSSTNVKKDFQKLFTVNNKFILGYASQTPINENDLINLNLKLSVMTNNSCSFEEVVNTLSNKILKDKDYPSPKPDSVLIGGYDKKPMIYKLNRDEKNYTPKLIKGDHAFIGWTSVAQEKYPKIKNTSHDVAIDLIQLTCNHECIHGLIGGKLKRFIADNKGTHEASLGLEINQIIKDCSE